MRRTASDRPLQGDAGDSYSVGQSVRSQFQPASSRERISLILCCYGHSVSLRVLFQSLRQQDCLFQLIIVDQNQDDYVSSILAEYPDLRATLLSSAPGLSRARNVGLRHAIAPVIAFPDDDSAYPPLTLSAVCDYFDASQGAGILCGSFTSNLGVLKLQQAPLAAKLSGPESIFRRAPSHTLFVDRRKLPEMVQWALFDERLGVGAEFGSSEETEYLFQLVDQGVHFYRTARFVSYHPNKDLDYTNLHRAHYYGLGVGAFFRKHLRSRSMFWPLAAIAFCGPVLRIALALITMRWQIARFYATVLLARCKGFWRWSAR